MRRSTAGAVGRLVGALVIIVAAHMVARLFYNAMFEQSYAYTYATPIAKPSIWSVQVDSRSDWIAFGISHVFAGLAFVILAVIIYVIYSLIRWIFFVEVEVVCVDPNCRCVRHGGMTYTKYKKKLQDEAARDALIATSAALITTTIVN